MQAETKHDLPSEVIVSGAQTMLAEQLGCSMVKARSLVLVATAIALIISSYFWGRYSAERNLARVSQATVGQGLPTPGFPGSQVEGVSKLRPLLGIDEQPRTPPPEVKRNVEAIAAVPPETSDKRTLTSPEYARRLIARNYPELRRDLGFSDEDVEALAGMIAEGAYPAEVERTLGAYRYQQWMDYRRARDAKQSVDTLQKRLSSAPLSDYQISALTLVLEEEQRRRDEQSPRQPSVASDARSKLDVELRAARLSVEKRSRVVDRARSFLNERQLAELVNDSYTKFDIDNLASLEAQRAKMDASGIK